MCDTQQVQVRSGQSKPSQARQPLPREKKKQHQHDLSAMLQLPTIQKEEIRQHETFNTNNMAESEDRYLDLGIQQIAKARPTYTLPQSTYIANSPRPQNPICAPPGPPSRHRNIMHRQYKRPLASVHKPSTSHEPYAQVPPNDGQTQSPTLKGESLTHA